MICIYKIVNPNTEVYIGATTNYSNRIKEHKKGKYENQPKLKKSFLQFGVDAHSYAIIRECKTVNELFKYECYYIGKYNSIETGLNIKIPTTPSNLMQQKHNQIRIIYNIKYELSFATHYVWLENDKCFNKKTGRFIKQVLCGGSIGYVINGKFKSLSYLRKHLQKPKKPSCPF